LKLALGTAQFGLSYGVANQNGQVDLEAGRKIVRMAAARGIDTIDTAIAYGESEQRLGDIGVNNFKVITKLPAIPLDCGDISAWVFQNATASLNRMGLSKLDGVLLHQPSQLLEKRGQEIYDALLQVQSAGLVNKIGVSIYEPKELADLMSRFSIDIVQAPFSILDQRLRTSGWLDKLAQLNVELHVRSIFLQGLLLMNKTNRPQKFDRWNTFWIQWHTYLLTSGYSALRACLAFVLSEKKIHRIVVGFESLTQLEECLRATNEDLTSSVPIPTCDDVELADPRGWSALV
jgi:aryl-alcohol dehydrogenase-like predicted oxidoreductase